MICSIKVKGAVVCHSLEEALKALKDYDEGDIYIIGGRAFTGSFFPIAQRPM